MPDDGSGLQVDKDNIHKACMAWDTVQAIQSRWICAEVCILLSLHFLLAVLNMAKNILISSIS